MEDVTPSDVLNGDSTTGPSGSLRDLNPVPGPWSLKMSQICWLPTTGRLCGWVCFIAIMTAEAGE